MGRSSRSGARSGGKMAAVSVARKPLRAKATATAKDQKNVKLPKASKNTKKQQKDLQEANKQAARPPRPPKAKKQKKDKKDRITVNINLKVLPEDLLSSFYKHFHKAASELASIDVPVDPETLLSSFKPSFDDMIHGEQSISEYLSLETFRYEMREAGVKIGVSPDLHELYYKFYCQDGEPPIILSDNGIDFFEKERFSACPDDFDSEDLYERRLKAIEWRNSRPKSPWAFSETYPDLKLTDEEDLEKVFADSGMGL